MPWQPIDQLAAVEQRLGTPTDTFAYSFKHYLNRLGLCAVGIVLGLFLVYMAIQMFREGIAFPLVLLALALATLTVTGLVIRRTLDWPHHRVKVFAAGLLNVERRRFIVLYWGQIESVWRKITIEENKIPFLPGRRSHLFTVQTTEGDKVSFTDIIGDVAELGEIIGTETTRRLMPRALKMYNAGETLHFGNWSLTQEGLTKGAKTFPWETISSVQINNGVMAIKQKGKLLWSALEYTYETPNMDVLLELIDSLRGEDVAEE